MAIADLRSPPVKIGLFVLMPLGGAGAERVRAIQERYDPRLAALAPPHLTLIGSSGMGPIAPDTPLEALRAVLEPIARETPPMVLPMGAPHHFMQTDVIVLPLDPHGPLRALHERIKTSGLPAERPRFAFTPHVTVSFYPEHPRARLRALLAERVPEPAELGVLQLYRTWQYNVRTELLLELALEGRSENG